MFALADDQLRQGPRKSTGLLGRVRIRRSSRGSIADVFSIAILPRALYRLSKTVCGDRLDQIVERSGFISTHGVVGVCSDHDTEGPSFRPRDAQHLESGHIR